MTSLYTTLHQFRTSPLRRHVGGRDAAVDRTLARARQLAQRRGMSLDEMIRDYLETLTSGDPAQDVAELERLWSEEEGDSGGWKWPREELPEVQAYETAKQAALQRLEQG